MFGGSQLASPWDGSRLPSVMGITKLAILPGFSAAEQAGSAANSTQIRLRMAFFTDDRWYLQILNKGLLPATSDPFQTLNLVG